MKARKTTHRLYYQKPDFSLIKDQIIIENRSRSPMRSLGIVENNLNKSMLKSVSKYQKILKEDILTYRPKLNDKT